MRMRRKKNLGPRMERCAAVSRALGLPPHLIPLNTIVIGYPKGEPRPKDKWNPSDVTYM